VVTASDGTFSATGTAPNTVASGWTVQAHYAGGGLHGSTNSPLASYNTLRHTTSLTLSISPISVHRGGTYSVSGTLTDTANSGGIASKTITFTATSPITISSRTTNTAGQYSATGLIAPTTPGTYSIQSHFAGDSLYNAVNSQVGTLGVTAAAAVAPAPSLATQIQQPQQGLALPIAKAGLSKTVNENTIVMLDGITSYSPNIGGKIVAYQWTQLPTTAAVPVNLIGASTANPTFTAPIVSADTVLVFSLKVMDNHDAASSNTAIVYVMVKHNTSSIPAIASNSINQPHQQQQQPTPTPNPFFHPQFH